MRLKKFVSDCNLCILVTTRIVMALAATPSAAAALLLLCCLLPSCSGYVDSTGCPEAFLSRCKCGPAHYPNSPSMPNAPTRFLVNCTNTGFKDASMLKELPEM